MALALILSAAALIAQRPAAVASAALAAGMSLGTRLTSLGPVAALSVGVVAIARSGTRLRTAAVWFVPLLLTGGLWYLRNLVATGSPLPQVMSFGPIDLPGPEQVLGGRPSFSVAHYLTDFGVWADWFGPGLDDGFGLLWPLVLALAAAGAVLALARGPSKAIRMLGAVAIVTALVYLVTPVTASGPEGEPVGFGPNLRYLAPGLALALGLLPVALTRYGTRVQVAGAAGLMAAAIAVAIEPERWEGGHLAAALVLGAVVALVLGGVALAARRREGTEDGRRRGAGPVVAIGLSVLALIAVAFGYFEQRRYLEDRYADPAAVLTNPGLDSVFLWSREASGQRIATTTTRQYPLYGTDLTNHVQFAGIEQPNGGFTAATTCEEWREGINAGNYDYVVTALDRIEEDGPARPPEFAWTASSESAEPILRDGPAAVFELTGPPRPRRLHKRPGKDQMNASLDLGAYLLGTLELAAIVLPLIYAAVIARRLLLPSWTGAPARLTEAITATALLLWSAELTGTLGLFKPIPLIITSLAVGAGAWALARRADPAGGGRGGPDDDPRSPQGEETSTGSGRQDPQADALRPSAVNHRNRPRGHSHSRRRASLGNPPGPELHRRHRRSRLPLVPPPPVSGLRPDRQRHRPPLHGPLLPQLVLPGPLGAAARGPDAHLRPRLALAAPQSRLPRPRPARRLVHRPPLGSRPRHADRRGDRFRRRDDDRLPAGRGPQRRDRPGLLPGGSRIVNDPEVRPLRVREALHAPVLVFAGLAAGLALGTKLTLLAPVAALVVGVAVLARAGERLRSGAVFLAAVIAGGGFWYARNLIHSGNPLPWIDSLGPISLPAPDVALELRPPFSVAHYATDTTVWKDWFFPGLTDAIGPLWPLVLILTLGTGLFAIGAALRAGGAADRTRSPAPGPGTRSNHPLHPPRLPLHPPNRLRPRRSPRRLRLEPPLHRAGPGPRA